MTASRNPLLYQINTRIWLGELSVKLARPATLDDISEEQIDAIAEEGFDWIWLLGIWRIGPAGRLVSLTQPQWREGFQRLLPDFRDEDVVGSPFAIRQYRPCDDFGGIDSLTRFRQRIALRGMKLMLDFVPNHTALDHPWVQEHPEYYVRGELRDLFQRPSDYLKVRTSQGEMILAHGRDPNYPGWPDTLQLNYRHPRTRAAMIGELSTIADWCDGVRCDMAMLLLPEVFLRTWGDAARPRDGTPTADTPFWPEAISAIHARHPQFLFMAEAYWDLEWTLQQQGFDYTYDKRLYDRLREGPAAAVRGHLWADLDYQSRSVRFLENHDEPRAAAVFPPPQHRAAAVVSMFVPGMRFFHEGQLQGRRQQASIHLRRRPDELPDAELAEFYRQLLDALKRPAARNGRWSLLDVRLAWEGNPTAANFLAFCWEEPGCEPLLVAVNYGATRGQCYVRLASDRAADHRLELCDRLAGRQIELRDILGPARYVRSGDELAQRGLYLDIDAWAYHVFEIVVG